jgi:hypothetical protein
VFLVGSSAGSVSADCCATTTGRPRRGNALGAARSQVHPGNDTHGPSHSELLRAPRHSTRTKVESIRASREAERQRARSSRIRAMVRPQRVACFRSLSVQRPQRVTCLRSPSVQRPQKVRPPCDQHVQPAQKARINCALAIVRLQNDDRTRAAGKIGVSPITIPPCRAVSFAHAKGSSAADGVIDSDAPDDRLLLGSCCRPRMAAPAPGRLCPAIAASARFRRPSLRVISLPQDCSRLPNTLLAAVHDYIRLFVQPGRGGHD